MTSRKETLNIGLLNLAVNPIGVGCWPMAGITSIGVETRQSIATIQAALDAGLNFFDTAYSYGFDGQCDALLREALKGRRSQAIVCHKVGQHWNSEKKRIIDGRPRQLTEQIETTLQRLRWDSVDVLYLHSPDPNVPLLDSIGALQSIQKRGLCRFIGVCNLNASSHAPFFDAYLRGGGNVDFLQLPFNMLQRSEQMKWREQMKEHSVSFVAYWVLRKGILAGRMHRDHLWPSGDVRPNYEIYQGVIWEKTHDLIDVLRSIATQKGCTVAQLVIAWTLCQPQIDFALVGMKTPEQAIEAAGAGCVTLTENELSDIDSAIKVVEASIAMEG